MLPLMVAMPRLDPVGATSLSSTVETGERADMGDAVAHLAGADHADLADGHAMPVRNGPADL